MEDMRNEAEYNKAIDVALELINMGLLTLEQIAQATKLPVEKIIDLAKA
jgi:hypothetical protein